MATLAYDYVELSRHVNDILPGEEPTSSQGSVKETPAAKNTPLTEVPEKTV